MKFDLAFHSEGFQRALPEAESLCAAIAAQISARFPDVDEEAVVLFTDNAALTVLNKQFREKDGPTNILSFPAAINAGYLGDMAIGFEICQKEADEQGKSFHNHVAHLLIHGTLHLLGYDHIEDEEAAEMEALEIEILASMGILNPYAID